MYLALASGEDDEVEQVSELLVAQLQALVVGSTSHGNDGKAAPMGNSCLDEQLLEFFQVVDVAAVHAGDDVPGEVRDGLHSLYCTHGAVKTRRGIA